jgi:BolA protein
MTELDTLTIEERIHTIIQSEFPGDEYEVVNESYKHHGHAGDDGSGQTHFKLKIVSSRFNDMSRVQAHRLVNDTLKELFLLGLHAISIECSKI